MDRSTIRQLRLAFFLAPVLGFLGHGPTALAEEKGHCANLYAEIGKPINLSEESDTVELCHIGYLANYNLDTKVADWVIERLTVTN